ncbi:MAG: hypothetical protein ACRD1K_09440 [Acidimicrobiales bacterium]
MAAGFETVVGRAMVDDIAGLEVLTPSSGMVRASGRAAVGVRLGDLPYLSVVLQELASMPFRSLDRDIPSLVGQLIIAAFATPNAASTAAANLSDLFVVTVVAARRDPGG